MGNLGPIPSEVAIPISWDRPGNAAGIAHHGAGEFIEDLTTERQSELIDKVLRDSSYRARANYIHQMIAKTHGLDRAADTVEQAFQNYPD